MTNSLQDSIRVISLLLLVSKTAFTPIDLNKVVSFLRTLNKIKLASIMSTMKWTKQYIKNYCISNEKLDNFEQAGASVHSKNEKAYYHMLSNWLKPCLARKDWILHKAGNQLHWFRITWSGEMPKWTAREARDWGETETITGLPLSILARNSSKLCFSSITVSAEVIQPLHN